MVCMSQWIELGKKLRTCTDPLEVRYFFIREIPALKLGEWSNVNIRDIGNISLWP